jgi:hypothetical protein
MSLPPSLPNLGLSRRSLPPNTHSTSGLAHKILLKYRFNTKILLPGSKLGVQCLNGTRCHRTPTGIGQR